jgi:hypothetical protein
MPPLLAERWEPLIETPALKAVLFPRVLREGTVVTPSQLNNVPDCPKGQTSSTEVEETPATN